MKLYSGTTLYQCEMCEKRFTEQEAVDNHMETHKGIEQDDDLLLVEDISLDFSVSIPFNSYNHIVPYLLDVECVFLYVCVNWCNI